jgi:predicted Zn-dependent protease
LSRQDEAAMRDGRGMNAIVAARETWSGLAMLLLTCAFSPALGQMRSWPAAGIANNAAENVRLVGANGNAVATVSRDLMRQLLLVQDRMQQQGSFAGELLITEGRGPNAFAVSARGRSIIGITTPMLDLLADDLDAYAALLGHEIAHHVRRHALERRSREQSLAGAGAIAALLLGAAGVRHGGTIADLGRAVVSTSYSRDDERDADRLGVEWMIAAGFDPEGALRLHERLLQRSGSGAIPFLQSHPAGEERVANIRQQIAMLAPSSNTAAEEIRAEVLQVPRQTPVVESDAASREAFTRGMAAYREQQFETAHREFLQAAFAGHPGAQHALGVLYSSGRGVAQDHALALEWYRKAAEQLSAADQTDLDQRLRIAW